MDFPAQIIRAAQKSLLVLGTVLLCSAFLAPQAHAQTYQPLSQPPQAVNPYTMPRTNPDVVQDQHTYVQTLLIELMAAGICQVAGVDPLNPAQGCLGVDPTTNRIGYVKENQGLIGTMHGMIASTFDMPVHTQDYVQDLASNFLIKPSYAAQQSVGFVGLGQLLFIWKAFRNLAYLGFVLAFAVIGVAVMLRVKIDARTVMSVQNQLPKIVMGLILVTFSYAIAAVLIDLMYVGIYLEFNLFRTMLNDRPTTLDRINQASRNFHGENPISFADQLLELPKFASSLAGQTKDQVEWLLSPDVQETLRKNGSNASNGWLGAALGGLAGSFLGPPGIIIGGILGAITGGGGVNAVTDTIKWGFVWIVGKIVSIVAFFIFAIAIVIALFRIWIALLKAYIFILVGTVLAPLWIMVGVFPGAQLNFSSWIRNMIANIAVFPATIFVFLLARVFMDAMNVVTTESNPVFIAPLTGNPNVGSINFLIGFGFLMITPSMINILQDALKAKPSQYTKEIGAGFSRGLAPVQGIGSSIGSRFWKIDQFGQGKGLINVYGQNIVSNVPGINKFQPGGNTRLSRIGGFIGKTLKGNYNPPPPHP